MPVQKSIPGFFRRLTIIETVEGTTLARRANSLLLQPRVFISSINQVEKSLSIATLYLTFLFLWKL